MKMFKRMLVAALLVPLAAFGQSYPSPTFNNLTVQGTFTATGKVGLASLATQAANTVVANVTGSSASPTAVAMPSCSASGNALNYTSGTGWSCATGYALLASPALTGTPTAPTATVGTNTAQIATTAFVLANAITSSSPTITTPNIVGVTNGSNAATGSVGEYGTNATAGTSLTTAAPSNCTSISLTAGDWDVSGTVTFMPAGTTVPVAFLAAISTTSATQPAGNSGAYQFLVASFATGQQAALNTPTVRISISATTTVYLVGTSTFTTSTMTCSGFIRARRVR